MHDDARFGLGVTWKVNHKIEAPQPQYHSYLLCAWVCLKQFWKESNSWAHPSRTYIIKLVPRVFFLPMSVFSWTAGEGTGATETFGFSYLEGLELLRQFIHLERLHVTVTRVSWSLGLLIFWLLSYLSDLSCLSYLSYHVLFILSYSRSPINSIQSYPS